MPFVNRKSLDKLLENNYDLHITWKLLLKEHSFSFRPTYVLVFHKINCMLHKFHVLWKRICMKIRTLHWPSDMIIDFSPLFITCIGAEHIVKKCMILNSRIYLEAVHTTVIVSEQTLGQICNRSLGASFRSWKRGQRSFFFIVPIFNFQCSAASSVQFAVEDYFLYESSFLYQQ